MANRHLDRPPSRPELLRSVREGQAQSFFCFEMCYSPIFYLSKIGHVLVNYHAFDFCQKKNFDKILSKRQNLNPSQFAKNKKLENPRSTILYHPNVHLRIKFQHERT